MEFYHREYDPHRRFLVLGLPYSDARMKALTAKVSWYEEVLRDIHNQQQGTSKLCPECRTVS